MDEVSPSTAVSTSMVVPSPTGTAASTATPTPDPTDTSTSSSGSSDQLSTWITIGAVIGGFLGIVFIVVVVMVVIMVRKWKKKDYTPPVEVKENVAYGVSATGGPGLEKNLAYGAFSEFTFCFCLAITKFPIFKLSAWNVTITFTSRFAEGAGDSWCNRT